MPQFDITPAAGNVQSLGDPSSGAVAVIDKKKKKAKVVVPARGKGGGKGGGKTGGAGGAGGGTTATGGTKKDDKKKPDKPRREPYNPLSAPFLTPNEIRAEAARLAALSVPTEQAIRQQYGAELAGVQGLSSALASRLGDVAARQAAAMQGFGNLYSQVATGAQQAGATQQAAAGAAPVAAGGTPTTIDSLQRNAYAITGYEPAALATGARLAAQTQAGLTKALVDRATRLSADTAKYLRDLQDREVQRAISQGTMAQNEARLNLSEQNAAWDQQVDVARLQQGQARIDLSAQRLAASLLKDAKKSKQTSAKKIQSAKDKILGNVQKWTKPKDVPTGEYNFKFDVDGRTMESTGRSPDDAWGKLIQSGGVDGGVRYGSYTQGREVTRSVSPNNEDVIKLLQPILVNAGMKPNRARAWILSNVLSYQPPTGSYAPSGAFLGGVGGSVA